MSHKKKMVSQNLTIIIIFLSNFSSLAHIEPAGHNSQITQTKNETQTQTRTKTVAYIESSCQETRYPDLCIRSLSTFAKYSTIDGPDHLAHIALSVSLTKALQTRGYLLKVVKQLEDEINNPSGHVYLTIQDCVQQINDSVDQLSQAIKELRRVNNLGKNINDKILWHISNVETWVSTALTDASYCVQSFPGYRMSKRTATIKVKAQNVAEVTSNGLALFHRYAVKYREAARSAKKP
ncbi:pectinesterase inhibitor 9-like [Cicer arietinum]|uniref:Pectinesterase inhibitor 9-like n=1 Tax=Cicer arietinum TaxID=3827 RepID=A0A1S2Z350_CICAR|nr:pectinesterase inhibitor 9-like [Cicer arietinum]